MILQIAVNEVRSSRYVCENFFHRSTRTVQTRPTFHTSRLVPESDFGPHACALFLSHSDLELFD